MVDCFRLVLSLKWLVGKVYSPLRLRIAMSGVVLENNLDFKQAVLLSLFCSGSFFFLLLNYQIIATEKI